MKFDILPERTDSAAGNMASDFLLLRNYPDSADHIRFRHYDWRQASVTFGYSQKIQFVRDQLSASPPFAHDKDAPAPYTLCRRPTGGGIVDHRHDWTYALVLPRGHALADAPAPVSYAAIHSALADTFCELGQPAILQDECPSGRPSSPTLCFTRAEPSDVIDPKSGRKLAGAAQKRSKEGLLFQGSIDKSLLQAIAWESFANLFIKALAQKTDAESSHAPWPDFPEGAHEALNEHYASPEWNEFR